MKYSYRWLKELSGTKKSPEGLAKLLIAHAFEVEGIEKYRAGLEGVVVGEVAGLKPHPDASKLRIAQVKIGKNESREIVCGAPNIAVGQMVAVALPGTLLPGGRRIEEAKIRGVVSAGMICSGRELGLSNDEGGILVLPEDVSAGTLFAKHFCLEDSILDVKILPDRGSDALAYRGLAREIAALDGQTPAFVKKTLKAVTVPVYNRAPKVNIVDKKGCRRYSGLFIQNVRVASSPLWLMVKLLVSGLRPINNVVDITNYLMLLLGQPMHAFDADLLKGSIVVRRAKKNEKLELLSGEVLKLTSEDMVIADEKRALALAGVMGGKFASVTEKTQNIFLEIASFDPGTVRRTKVRYNLSTDSSYRFERNVDPNLPTEALREAARLFPELTSGRVMGLRDITVKMPKPWKITLSPETVEKVLGIKIPLFAIVQYLALLGLKVKKANSQKTLTVTVESHRPDLQDEWDLIEEVGRMHGYDKILPVAPRLELRPQEVSAKKTFESSAKKTLIARGFDEIMTYSFYGRKDWEQCGLTESNHRALENPMNPDQEYLRFSLLPLTLRKIRENLKHFSSFQFFEWGSVFSKAQGETSEAKMLALALVREKSASPGEAYFALKGKLWAFFETLGLKNLKIVPLSAAPDWKTAALFHKTRSAVILAEGKVLGVFGELHPLVRKKYGLPETVAVAELMGESLENAERKEGFFQALQKYPYAVRDLSLTFPKKTTVEEIEAMLRQAGGPLLRRYELFDIYEQGKEKSAAYHLSFGASDRTLSSKEMDAAFDRIVAEAAKRLDARLRNGQREELIDGK